MITYTNISFYNKKLTLIENTFDKSLELCRGNSLKTYTFHCAQTLEFLSIQIPKLNQKEETLGHLINHRRSRRGVFNGGGYALNWLFGVPDADDAQYYNDAIKRVEEDDKNLQILMKEQIQVIKSTISNFNESIGTLKIQEKLFNENIEKFNMFIQNTIDKESVFESSVIVTGHMNKLTYLVNELNEQYDQIIDAVLFAKSNILHPVILTPKHFIDEINNNVKLLTDGKSFPLPLDYDNAYKLLDLSRLRVYYQDGKLVFVVQVPLVKNQLFNIYNLFSLPIPKDSSTYAFIEPMHPYVAISGNKMQYVQLKDFQQCQPLAGDDMICEVHLIYSTLEKPSCETSLLTSTSTRIPGNCKTHMVKGTIEIWHPLRHNQWIFVLSDPDRITIDCPETEIIDRIVQETGILTLKEGCRAYSKLSQLIASGKVVTIYRNLIPEINILEDDCCSKKQSNKSNNGLFLSPIHLTNVRLDDLKQASHRLDILKDHVENLLNQPHIVKHGRWYVIAMQIIGLILGLLFLHKLFSCMGLYTLLRLMCCPRTNQRRGESTGCLVNVYNHCFNPEQLRTEAVPVSIAMAAIPEDGNLLPLAAHESCNRRLGPAARTMSRTREISGRRSISSSRDDVMQGFSTSD